MGPLGRFRRLRSLDIEGHSKDIEVVSELAELQDLTFRPVTLPNPDVLVPLRKLRALDIKLGGTMYLSPLGPPKWRLASSQSRRYPPPEPP
jgi:hypothetical protein